MKWKRLNKVSSSSSSSSLSSLSSSSALFVFKVVQKKIQKRPYWTPLSSFSLSYFLCQSLRVFSFFSFDFFFRLSVFRQSRKKKKNWNVDSFFVVLFFCSWVVVFFNQSRRKASSSSLFFLCGLFEPSDDLLTPLTREREIFFSTKKGKKRDKKKSKKTIPIRKTSSFITFDTRRIYTSTLLSDDEETTLV